MTTAPTQPQLPLSKNNQLGLRRQRRRCGYCGSNVTINKDRTMRVHGPKHRRCAGSSVPWTPHFRILRLSSGSIMRWGTCGICGALADAPDPQEGHSRSVEEAYKAWMRKHDHERPHITKDRETGLWVVLIVNHRTGKRLTIECETNADAYAKAVELIELQK